jgi:hypothetical protein
LNENRLLLGLKNILIKTENIRFLYYLLRILFSGRFIENPGRVLLRYGGAGIFRKR